MAAKETRTAIVLEKMVGTIIVLERFACLDARDFMWRTKEPLPDYREEFVRSL